jgi:hypothetical protein
MRKSLILTTLLVLSFNFSFGQIVTDSISVQKVFGGYNFYQGAKRLSINELKNAMKLNDQAYREMKSAQSANIFATIIGGVGGFMVGWPIGTAIGGGDPNWVMAGIGAGLIVVSIPISQKFNKHAKRAVHIFNNGLKTSTFWQRNELRYSMSKDGVGLALRF